MSRADEHFDALDNTDALIREARSGSIDALGELLQRYRPLLLRIAGRLMDRHLQSKADHMDLVQQVFLKALKNISSLRGETIGQFVEWITRIMSDEVAKTRRRFGPSGKRAVGREVGLSEDGADALQAPERWDQELWHETLRHTLPALRADEQLVLLLHDLEEMPFSAIAMILHRSENAVRKLRKRALRHGREAAASMN